MRTFADHKGEIKMKTIALIRHGKTEGNLEKRYIGRTDQPLCRQGIDEIKSFIAEGRYPSCELLFVSPMIRCLQTAKQIYPDQSYTVKQDLREFDFGIFEGKNYTELKDDPLYSAFLEGGEIPGGESLAQMKSRCMAGFSSILHEMEQSGCKTASVVCHGGTIMAILDAFSDSAKEFYSYWIENGGIYLCRVEEETNYLTIIEKKAWEKWIGKI